MEIDREARQYLEAQDVDQLARQNTQLMAELWMVKDRLAVLEKLLVDKGLLAEREIDALTPEGEFAAQLDRERERFIQRVVGLPPEERTLENLKALGKE